ncbi:hypothetical protein CCAX7_35360 [Capsulimonas corticalis]|uniref:Uncharacterized protein n=1 Tax=Capsulimonas corticalis TaxID=2219043 RepID=A0A402CY57_9BACT|nr:hypothetical protein [Capsulimonas corticalis]BDI31485.1 hypothetical protein CCAX7_35360 [Capsulimonas corticalis]
MAERHYSQGLLRSAYLSSNQDHRQSVPRNQQLALFLHLARILLRLARRIPWSRLCEHDEASAMEATEILKEALSAAPAPPGK